MEANKEGWRYRVLVLKAQSEARKRAGFSMDLAQLETDSQGVRGTSSMRRILMNQVDLIAFLLKLG